MQALGAVRRTDETNLTRAKILEVSTALLARFTVSKFTMEDVARAAGIARQTIYKHFSGKDDLLIELFVQQMEQEQHPVLRRLDEPPSPEALVTLFMAEFASPATTPCTTRCWIRSWRPGWPSSSSGPRSSWPAGSRSGCPSSPGMKRPACSAGARPRAVVRWITYQQFWLLTHPTVLCHDDETLTDYVREFVVAVAGRAARSRMTTTTADVATFSQEARAWLTEHGACGRRPSRPGGVKGPIRRPLPQPVSRSGAGSPRRRPELAAA